MAGTVSIAAERSHAITRGQVHAFGQLCANWPKAASAAPAAGTVSERPGEVRGRQGIVNGMIRALS
jgi:hypothetical protein